MRTIQIEADIVNSYIHSARRNTKRKPKQKLKRKLTPKKNPKKTEKLNNKSEKHFLQVLPEKKRKKNKDKTL